MPDHLLVQQPGGDVQQLEFADLLVKKLPVQRVKMIEVDMVGPQPLQLHLQRPLKVVRLPELPQRQLGRKHHPVPPPRLQRQPHGRFAESVAVSVRGIHIIDAPLKPPDQQRHRRFQIRLRLPFGHRQCNRQPHGPETQPRNLPPGPSEFGIPHASLP